MFEQRRAAFFSWMKQRGSDTVAVLPSTPVHIRNHDVEHDYRQDSDLYYLTGFDEPSTVGVFDAATDSFFLFVRPRDPEREVWDGARAGVEGAVAKFGATKAFPIGDLAKELPTLLRDRTRLVYRVGRDREFDERMFSAIDRTKALVRRGGEYPVELLDPALSLHEMRLRKSDEEVALMRKASAITTEAHKLAMASVKPGMFEYEIEALLLGVFRKHGSERPAYGSIVGSGPNATVLHYRANHRQMQDGELLLIDAGCEYGYYASDVTRTFPVSGRFSAPQQAIYELVLEAELACIEMTRPGTTLDAIHARAVEVLTTGLVRLGILRGDVPALIEEEKYKPFYMHRTSHWLGMDVHDVGAYFVQGAPRKLEPGMVLTIEPGLYFAKDADVPAEYRGIGVRIEDDILVTTNGCENLTSAIPKSVAELAALQR
jgi:Xaa-Pro aminopeptidase